MPWLKTAFQPLIVPPTHPHPPHPTHPSLLKAKAAQLEAELEAERAARADVEKAFDYIIASSLQSCSAAAGAGAHEEVVKEGSDVKEVSTVASTANFAQTGSPLTSFFEPLLHHRFPQHAYAHTKECACTLTRTPCQPVTACLAACLPSFMLTRFLVALDQVSSL